MVFIMLQKIFKQNPEKSDDFHKNSKKHNWPIGKPRPPLFTVAPSDKQTELLTILQWQLQCENLVPRCFSHFRTQKATKWEWNIP